MHIGDLDSGAATPHGPGAEEPALIDIVFDGQVESYGWGGVRAAGWFSPEWQLRPGDYVVR